MVPESDPESSSLCMSKTVVNEPKALGKWARSELDKHFAWCLTKSKHRTVSQSLTMHIQKTVCLGFVRHQSQIFVGVFKWWLYSVEPSKIGTICRRYIVFLLQSNDWISSLESIVNVSIQGQICIYYILVGVLTIAWTSKQIRFGSAYS